MIDKTMCEVLWRNISDFYVNLRVEVGKHPQVILAMYFNLDKNNERPDWMTDLKLPCYSQWPVTHFSTFYQFILNMLL